MQNRIVVQGRTKGDSPLTQVIAGAVAGGNLDRLDVAVAYATLSGLDELEKALGGFAPTSRWLIGLDDAVSQPAALDRIIANRSDLALILSKQSAPVDYAIDYTMVGSPGYAALVSRSTAIGTLKRTINGPAGRNFGFF
jgi:hypothetical protein